MSISSHLEVGKCEYACVAEVCAAETFRSFDAESLILTN
jgi:hypothetical protein